MEDVVTRALAHFDLAGALVAFVSASENTVYRVDAPGGRRFALRVHRPGYHNLAALESEASWTTALSDAGVDTPRPVQTRTGSGYATVPYGVDGEIRYVGLIEWVDGEPLDVAVARGEIDLMPLLDELGALVAQMHKQAATFEQPPGFVRHVLDAKGLIGDDPWWGPFWDVPEFSPDEKSRILEVRERLLGWLEGYGQGRDVFSLIHADLLPSNLLVRPDGRVSAIDFDDAAFGWHLYDIAVALHEFADHAQFDDLRAAFLGGYLRHRVLTDEDAARLPIFHLIRCLVEIGWFDSRLDGYLTHSRGGNTRETLIAPLARRAVALTDDVLPLL